MSSTAPSAPPPIAPARPPAGVTLVDENIRRTRRGLWLVDLGSGVITLLIGVLLYLLAAAVLDHWIVPGGLSGWGRAALFTALTAGILWYAWRAFRPLLHPINPIYAAHTIETSSPSLKNSLLNLLLFRSSRDKMSQRVYQAIEQQAADRLAESPLDAVIDRTALLRLGYVLAAVIAVCALYRIVSPKDPAISAQRVLAPWANVPAPSRVQIEDVTPGDTSIARGERLEVSAEVLGVADEEAVRLHYSTVDRQIVDRHVEMQRLDGTMRYMATLPVDEKSRGDASGIQHDLNYWIEAGDARSSEYLATVYARPTLVVTAVHYEYPAYTGYRSETIRDSGDIRGIEGTRVRIEAIANQPIENAAVDFDADGRTDLTMQIDGDRATATFRLALREDRRTPEHGSYALRLKTTSGRENRDPPVYQIDVSPDYPPEIRQVTPEESPLPVQVDETVRIAVEARDPDFALSEVSLLGRVGERSIELGALLADVQSGNFQGALELTPANIELKPGDVLQYWAQATDNRQPEGNRVETPRRELRIVGPGDRQLPPNQPPQDPQNQDQNQQQEQQGDGQAGGEGQQGQEGGAGQPQEGGQGEQGDQSGQGAQGQTDQATENQPEGAGGQGGGENGGENAPNQSGANSPADANAQGQDGAEPNPAEPDQGPRDQASQQQQPDGQSGQSGEQDQAEAGQPDPVSPEGDQDGQAFERIAEHFDPAENQADQTGEADQQAQPEEQGQQNQPAGETQPDGQQQGQQQQQGPAGDSQSNPRDGQQQQQQQGESQEQPSGNPAGQPDAASPDAASQEQANPQAGNPQGDAGQEGPQDQGQQPNQPSGPQDGQREPGAEQRPEPGEQQPSADGPDAETGDPTSPDAGQPNQEQPGAEQNGEKQSGQTPDNPNTDSGESPSELDDPGSGQPSAPSQNQGEPGDGTEPGDPQGAPEADPKKPTDKSDSPTNSKSPDDAAAPAESQGQSESDTQGEQSGDRSGEGQEGAGQQADAPGEGGAGENQPSDQGAGAADQPGPGETGQGEGDAPGEPSGDPSDKTAAAEQNEGRPGEAEGESGEPSETDRQNRTGQESEAAGSSNSGAPEAGGEPGGQPGAGEASDAEPLPGDDPNLDYAKQQTDLVLDRLEDQLAQQQVDESLLDKLGWSEADLKRFVDRWKGLKERAAGGEAQDQQQLADALRKLGLRRDRAQRFRAGGTSDSLRDLNESYRTRVPQKYRDQARAYVEGVSSGAEQP